MKNITTLTPQFIEDIIKSTNGGIFGITFTKRTTGELRHMRARIGVKKGLKGIGLPYHPKNYNLMIVYDMQKGYRAIPLDAVHRIKFIEEFNDEKWESYARLHGIGKVISKE